MGSLENHLLAQPMGFRASGSRAPTGTSASAEKRRCALNKHLQPMFHRSFGAPPQTIRGAENFTLCGIESNSEQNGGSRSRQFGACRILCSLDLEHDLDVAARRVGIGTDFFVRLVDERDELRLRQALVFA